MTFRVHREYMHSRVTPTASTVRRTTRGQSSRLLHTRAPQNSDYPLTSFSQITTATVSSWRLTIWSSPDLHAPTSTITVRYRRRPFRSRLRVFNVFPARIGSTMYLGPFGVASQRHR